MANQKLEQASPLERYKESIKVIEARRLFILLTGESSEQVFETLEEIKEIGHELVCVDYKIPGVKDKMKSYKRKGLRRPGVFSISTAKDARNAINAGAEFVFTTHADKAVSKKCRHEKIFHATGALTPKEVYQTYEQGADAVSIYPCSKMGGVSWIVALKEIFPEIKLIPTDKMSPPEAGDYLRAGAYAVAPIVDTGNTGEARVLIQGFIDSKLKRNNG